MSRPLPPSRLRFPLLTTLAGAALVAACGGGGTPTTQLSGSVVKGPVSGAEVCAYRLVGGSRGDRLQCATTNAAGAYTMALQYEGAVVVEATGGSYQDEATGSSRTLAEPMRVVVQAQGGSTTGIVTPLTTVAYSIASGGSGGVSAASFASAAGTVSSQFQLTGVNIATAVPLVDGTSDAYGRMLRAVSQYLANGGSLANFQAWADPASFQAALATAYAAINGSSITFSFSAAGAGGASGSSGGTGSAGGAGGTESCGITVSGSGTVMANGMTLPFNLPPTKICVTGLPSGACTAGNAQLQSVAAAGAAPSGNYDINYSYSYAPNDCSGALATVTYTP